MQCTCIRASNKRPPGKVFRLLCVVQAQQTGEQASQSWAQAANHAPALTSQEPVDKDLRAFTILITARHITTRDGWMGSAVPSPIICIALALDRQQTLIGFAGFAASPDDSGESSPTCSKAFPGFSPVRAVRCQVSHLSAASSSASYRNFGRLGTRTQCSHLTAKPPINRARRRTVRWTSNNPQVPLRF